MLIVVDVSSHAVLQVIKNDCMGFFVFTLIQ